MLRVFLKTTNPPNAGNWRGPLWINVNCVLAYALQAAGFKEEALRLAGDVTTLLADDLRRTGTWHENYDSETGHGLGKSLNMCVGVSPM